VELLVVLTRVAVTQLAATVQQPVVPQLALAAILTFGQKYIDLKNRKRTYYRDYPNFIYEHLNYYLILPNSSSCVEAFLSFKVSSFSGLFPFFAEYFKAYLVV
jgi:hypothetical protein